MPTMREFSGGAICNDGCKTDCIHYRKELQDCRFHYIAEHLQVPGDITATYVQRNCHTACILGVNDDDYCLFGAGVVMEPKNPEECEFRKAWSEAWSMCNRLSSAVIKRDDELRGQIESEV